MVETWAGGCEHGVNVHFRPRTGGVQRLQNARFMRLSDAAGSVFELEVTGYQFPDSTWREKKYSWHMVRGAVTFEGESWRFHWQALACDETSTVSAWLRSVADWIEAAGTKEGQLAAAPEPLIFMEPHLAFRVVPAREPGLPGVEVQLRLEFRNTSREESPSPVDAEPIVLLGSDMGLPFDLVRITASPKKLRSAADEWDAESARYPDGLIGVPAAELRAETQARRARGGDWMSG